LIDVADFSGTSSLGLNLSGEPGELEFAGTLRLRNGVPTDADVAVVGDTTSAAIIDLYDAGVAGSLHLAGGAATIQNGGPITGDGQPVLFVSSGSILGPLVYSGTATFESVECDCSIGTESGSGGISGTVEITGDLDGSFAIRDGHLYEDGEIIIGGDVLGSVEIYGRTGDEGDIFGRIEVGGELMGSVFCESDLLGSIEIASDVSGSMTIVEDIESGGLIQIGDGLKDSGTIEVGGLTSGIILVDQQMTEASLINAIGGFGGGGIIDVNGQGDYTTLTEGTIHVGGDSGDTPYSTVPFSGFIQINCPGLGTFEGLVEVVGCAASANQLATICIRGTDNGTVTFYDSGCTDGYTQDCSFECAAPYRP
jgi:hypothetical protein